MEPRSMPWAVGLTPAARHLTSALVWPWGWQGTTQQRPQWLGTSRAQRVVVPQILTGSAKALSHSTVAVALWSWLP